MAILLPLVLPGCGDGGVTSNLAVPDAVLANATADTGGGAHYRCNDGRTVRAEFADPQTLTLHVGRDAILMHDASSAEGARFVGGGWRWSVRDLTRASLVQADDGGTPVGQAVTCTVE